MCCDGSCQQCNGYITRRYISRKERIDWLSEYKNALEAEVEGVKERIAALEAAPSG